MRERKIELEKWLKENRNLEEKVRVLEFSLMNMNVKENEMEMSWPIVAGGSLGGIAMVVVLLRFLFGKKR